ncbi:MAG: RNA polymerase sigma factor [Bacteroidales bacterium]|nr:RNA polymerase sigma factor [Bacteroidales bacterium]
MWNEAQIIEGCCKGDKRCQELLFKKYKAVLFGLSLRYCKCREDAEDVLQEGFVKIFSGIKTFRMEGSFEGWLKRIVVNTALNHYKANLKFSFMQNYDDINENDLAGANELHEQKFSSEELMAMVQSLPDGYRVVFNLYAIEGFSHKQIAEMLNINENTSKSQLSRARQVLQKKLINNQKAITV